MLKIKFADLSDGLAKSVAIPLFAGDEPKPALFTVLDEQTGGCLTRALNHADFSAAHTDLLDLPALTEAYHRIVLTGLGKRTKFNKFKAKRAGATVASALSKEKEAAVVCDFKDPEQVAAFALGALLKNYRFERYFSKKPEKSPALTLLTVLCPQPQKAEAAFAEAEALAQGVYFARDLISEPANVLTPSEMAKRCDKLSKLGLKVHILKKDDLEKAGFGSLLSVSQGSQNEPRVVVMEWSGKSENGKLKNPTAFIGKGVTFDSGGISLKPAAGMDEMKTDMSGAAAVIGLMQTLALRKAKVDAVGVVGLVENMPSGTATRPGDVVKSYSGKTIEILNTDAEGRLVLADILWYAQEEYKPSAVIDLATLTGAVVVALGSEYAGLFSNDDKLADQLQTAGKETGELLWRMPLAKAYDKLIDSDIADVKNISGGKGGGSITAAQFLQRFIQEDVAWAHLDIAGAARSDKDLPLSPKGAVGFGVSLLNNFVKATCEETETD